jgi:outer membrane murein-binding lipoprotein Lpp
MPIDDRIRHLIREEVAAPPHTGGDGSAGLQQQITELHEHLHRAATTIARLEQRVNALEKDRDAGTQTAMRAATKRTASRKSTGE